MIPHDPTQATNPVLAHALELQDLAERPGDTAALALAPQSNPLHLIRTQLRVCVGELSLTVGELMNAREHHVFTLDRMLADPVDLMLEGHVVARGELIAVDDHFAVRITELPKPLTP